MSLAHCLNSTDFDGHVDMTYSRYRSSRTAQYQTIKHIVLQGDLRENQIMTNWISRHYPEITLINPLAAFADQTEFDRLSIESEGENALSSLELYRYYEFWRISSALADAVNFNNLFDVDHANSIRNHGMAAIHPDNLQLMLFRANRKKGSADAVRYSWSRQEQVIYSVINAVAEPYEDNKALINTLITQLKAIY